MKNTLHGMGSGNRPVERSIKILKYSVFIILTILLIILSGCKTCKTVEQKYFEKVPVHKTIELKTLENYSYTVPRFEEDCTLKTSSILKEGKDYSIKIADKVWLYSPQITGENNQLKRTVFLTNLHNEDRLFYVEIIHLKDGKEISRSESLKHGISAKAEKRFFVTWNTEYDIKKDVTLAVVDEDDKEVKYCVKNKFNITKTGTREIITYENKTTFETVEKIRLVKRCS